MEKLIYPPTGVSVQVNDDAVEPMLNRGFVRATAKSSTTPKPQTKKTESKSTTKTSKK